MSYFDEMKDRAEGNFCERSRKSAILRTQGRAAYLRNMPFPPAHLSKKERAEWCKGWDAAQDEGMAQRCSKQLSLDFGEGA